MKGIINVLLVLIYISSVYSLGHVSHLHKPHFFHRSHYSDVITKEELNNLFNVEYIMDGDKKAFGEVNDVMDLKVTAIFKRGKKEVREAEREMHVSIGDSNIYYCYNIVSAFLSVGQKIKIVCPNRIGSKVFVGKIPHKDIVLEIEVLKISKAWKLAEIEETFKVQYLDDGKTTHFTKMGDVVDFHHFMYHAETNEEVYSYKTNYLAKHHWQYVIGHHDAIECVEIVLSLVHLGQNIRFFCPQKYCRYEKFKQSLGEEELWHTFDTWVEGHIHAVRKPIHEDL
jgi:hypothetical protein